MFRAKENFCERKSAYWFHYTDSMKDGKQSKCGRDGEGQR